jgi:hypothetical protein
MSVKSDEQSGCPSTSRNDKTAVQVSDLMENNIKLAIYEMPDEVGISCVMSFQFN